MAANNDSADLEALFDSISSDYSSVATAAPAPAPVVEQPAAAADGDSDDLQALFDSVAAETVAAKEQVVAPATAPGGEEWSKQEAVSAASGWMFAGSACVGGVTVSAAMLSNSACRSSESALAATAGSGAGTGAGVAAGGA